MSKYNPKIFTDVDSLGALDSALLIQLFHKFPGFFAASAAPAAHNFPLSNRPASLAKPTSEGFGAQIRFG